MGRKGGKERPSRRAKGFFVATDIFDGALLVQNQQMREDRGSLGMSGTTTAMAGPSWNYLFHTGTPRSGVTGPAGTVQLQNRI